MAQDYDNMGKNLWTEHADDLSRFVLDEELMRESKTYQYLCEKILKEATIENTLALLADQFQAEAVNALTPALQRVNDLQKLKQLHLAAAKVPNIETFAQMLNE